MKKTTVFIFIKDRFVPAGLLSFELEGRHSYSVFQYGKKYLLRADAISLDPIHLPLENREFQTPEGFDLFNGIRDAGPDKWGRYLLDKKFSQSLSEIDYILEASSDRVGALAFGEDPMDPPLLSAQKRLDLMTLAHAVENTLQGEAIEKIRHFLEYGPSLGGARPKATVDWNGAPYIAKFSISMDERNEALIEFATMTLAKLCGLNVPDVQKASIKISPKNIREVYLIKRFDRIQLPKNNLFYPVPFISGLTVTGLHESDYQMWSYRALCDAILKFSSNPKRDKMELFKRMVFNILVFNNDDHLRNHGFLYAGNGHWDLSPLYDVVPSSIRSETYMLSLKVGDYGKEASLRNALSAARYFDLSSAVAEKVIQKMSALVVNWEKFFTELGVSKADIGKLQNSFRGKD